MLAWRKSTHSGLDGCIEVAFTKSSHSEAGNCVEVGHVHVRDSKDPTGPVLAFTPHEWQAFLARVRDGEFDL
jgi:hypothetical protein